MQTCRFIIPEHQHTFVDTNANLQNLWQSYQLFLAQDFEGSNTFQLRIRCIDNRVDQKKSVCLYSHSLWLDLLKIKHLKHQAPHVRFAVDSVCKPMYGLLDCSRGGVSQPPIVLKLILYQLSENDEMMKVLIPQVSATELVHQGAPVLFL